MPCQVLEIDELRRPLILDIAETQEVAEVMVMRPLPGEMTPQSDALLQRRRPLLEMLVTERHRVALAHAPLQ